MDDHATTSNEVPAPPPLSPSVKGKDTSLSTPDRNSAIALGIILCVVIATILYSSYHCLQRRRLEAQLDADLPSTLPTSSLTDQTRDSYHHLRGSRLMSEGIFSNTRRLSSWGGSTFHSPSFSECGGERKLSEAALDNMRDRRWWGSVARYGCTSVADKKISVPLPMCSPPPPPPPPPPPAPPSTPYAMSPSSSGSRRGSSSCPKCGHALDLKQVNEGLETIHEKEKADVRFGSVRWGGEVRPVWCSGVRRKTSLTVEDEERRNEEEGGLKWMEPVVTAGPRKDSAVKRIGGVERMDWYGGWI
ncbi:hypothetical protein BDV96DRAFT_646205 [Lophiotrema nucula]|uniref:Uncharacterized protein n=1 Tax=Lophiotrema nucula TaxID=690887 RepID=A0A6A5Z8Y1_9PLEO|nr:hypothetical protein BDV96DRAFT_646205 [Lophiotrema nucula]